MTKQPTLETILIVDTDPLQRALVGQYLRDCGHRVLEATNAEEALKVLESQEVDVLVTHLALRDASGFELSARARETRPSVSVVLTHSPQRTAKVAADLCEDGPLDHPYHPQHLVDRIKRLRGS
ncbi:MAG: response regulator [Pseudorhizobium sp.]